MRLECLLSYLTGVVMIRKLLAACFLASLLVGCASVPMGDAKKDAELKSFTA